MASTETTTHTVAQFDDLQDGQMKQVSVAGLDILLVRVDGKYHAMGAHCVHYGAPLVKGVLTGNHLICPWHHAVYDVTTGDHIEPPGRNCLTSFSITINGQDVDLTVTRGASEHRMPDFCKANKDDLREIGIVGAGAAASMAAETLRKEGFTGKITLLTYEDDFPYDRPNISKEYMAGEADPEWMPLRSPQFYADNEISIVFGRRVTNVDLRTREVTFDDDERRTFDMLLLATGGTPRTLPVPGADGKNVFLLRTMHDADQILERLADIRDTRRVVIIGSSFIGMEVASSLRHRDVEVTVVSTDKVPFEKNLGPRVGRFLFNLHQQHGVEFHLDASVERIESSDNGTATTTTVLADGTRLESDLVIVGIGVRPATDFIQGTTLNKDGSLTVDASMKLTDPACPNVWAAGDIATFPHPQTGQPIRVEHWRLANQHGKIAGCNMAGNSKTYQEVPFFWTRHHGTTLKYVGHTQQWDNITFDGSPESGDFVAYYIKDGRVLAACGTRSHALTQIHAQFHRGEFPQPPIHPTSEDSAQL